MTQEFENVYISDNLFGGTSKVKLATLTSYKLTTDFAANKVIDEIKLNIGDRILIKSQDNPIENGIYIITENVPYRSLENETGKKINGLKVWIEEGLNKSKYFVCVSEVTKSTVGTDEIFFKREDAIGVLDINRGGTGLQKLSANKFLVGNDENPILFKDVPTGDVVGTNDTQTLTNKTLINPIVVDDKGQNIIELKSQPESINKIALTNAATQYNPSISVVGGDDSIDLDFFVKGEGVYNFNCTEFPSEIRLHSKDKSIGIASPESISNDYILVLPDLLGKQGQVLTLADDKGHLTFSASNSLQQTTNISSPIIIPINNGPIIINNTNFVKVGYFSWNSSILNSINSAVVSFYIMNCITGIDIQVINTTNEIVGSINSNKDMYGIKSFGLTLPKQDELLILRVKKNGSGVVPQIYGIQLILT
jgi:hypothetical protein